ncbi:hypothetical protein OG592_22945 [Streptomyces avidinii]|uniref:hypothetical protein n=1 Tax=Streptomyces avidinii TaxID=1895 RepID=UPI00386AE0E4|nr:hypothetical protein OG592_22945 [Streptomyces avidinii]
MSVRDEREPLDPRTTPLYDYALFRHGIEPDGHVPSEGYPLPDGSPPEPSGKGLTWKKTHPVVTAALLPLLADPDPVRAAEAVHRQVAGLLMPHHILHGHVARLFPADEDAARRTARQLIRTGTRAAAVGVGMALLNRLGEPEDVPYLKALGMLQGLGSPAAAALDRLDRQAAALLILSGRTRSDRLKPLRAAAAAGDAGAVRTALLTLAQGPPAGSPRRIAEAADLHGLLHAHPEDDAELLAVALRLLHSMSRQLDHRADILDYGPAVAVYERALAAAHRLPPTPGHHALLLSTALDLHSSPAALLDWAPGRREALLDGLDRLLAGPPWATVRADGGEGAGADWIRRNARLPFARKAPVGPGPRWEVAVVHTGAETSAVETRILVDGLPLLPALFEVGPCSRPEMLLDGGRLRAGPRPREVRLAAAHCGESCCGALYVTIRREGAEVVWDGWRGTTRPQPPPYRFDAAAYDAEVERAEGDHSWCWPARSTARLITAGLQERPDLLGRWDIERCWALTDWNEPEKTLIQFSVVPPGSADGPQEGPPARLFFEWYATEDDGSAPQDRAAAVLEQFAVTDPKGLARLHEGSRALAESLGYDRAQK